MKLTLCWSFWIHTADRNIHDMCSHHRWHVTMKTCMSWKKQFVKKLCRIYQYSDVGEGNCKQVRVEHTINVSAFMLQVALSLKNVANNQVKPLSCLEDKYMGYLILFISMLLLSQIIPKEIRLLGGESCPSLL